MGEGEEETSTQTHACWTLIVVHIFIMNSYTRYALKKRKWKN